MMLRSSSTPILGSLLSSFSESPNNNHHHHHSQPEITLTTQNKHPPIPLPLPHNKLSHHQTVGLSNTFSCKSSPVSPSVASTGFRRAQSEGNLASLADSTVNKGDDFSHFNQPKKLSSRFHASQLETIPSFSFRNSRNNFEDEFSDDEEEEDEDETFQACNDISSARNKTIDSNKEMRYGNGYGNLVMEGNIGQASHQMFLARGLGVEADFGGGSGRGNITRLPFGNGSGDNNNVEEHYKKMVSENPGNPLFLRNYAQFLYQSKQDLPGAEEYYSRAILADPNDGEILAQYAKLQWELHHDKDIALGYFERAVQAASEDSHVHAAYASFLWDVEDEEEDEDEDSYGMQSLHHYGAMASASA